MQLSDFRRGESLFLLGSVASNPWVDLFLDRLDFQVRFDPVGGHRVNIRKLAPGDPQELAGMNLTTAASSGTTGEAYASLALITGLDGRGRVLIAQGTNMEGTELAAGLALDPTALAGQLERCGIDPTSPAASFEILLRLDTTASSVRNWSVLASRCYPEAGAAPLTVADKQPR